MDQDRITVVSDLVRTHSGVCHSDMGVMECTWRGLPHPTQKGQVGGHEGVGKIVSGTMKQLHA